MPAACRPWPGIFTVAVSGPASGQGQLTRLVQNVEAARGIRPAAVLAGAGYCNEASIEKLETLGMDSYVTLGRESRRGGRGEESGQGADGGETGGGAGRAQHAERKRLSKAPIGWIREALRFRRFSVRGLERVRDERELVCLAPFCYLAVRPVYWCRGPANGNDNGATGAYRETHGFRS